MPRLAESWSSLTTITIMIFFDMFIILIITMKRSCFLAKECKPAMPLALALHWSQPPLTTGHSNKKKHHTAKAPPITLSNNQHPSSRLTLQFINNSIISIFSSSLLVFPFKILCLPISPSSLINPVKSPNKHLSHLLLIVSSFSSFLPCLTICVSFSISALIKLFLSFSFTLSFQMCKHL